MTEAASDGEAMVKGRVWPCGNWETEGGEAHDSTGRMCVRPGGGEGSSVASGKTSGKQQQCA